MATPQIYIVTATTAILHNNQRYEKGDRIELTAEEAENLSLYIQLDEAEAQRQQAEKQAEQARLQAEAKQKESDTADKKDKAQKDKDQKDKSKGE